MLPQHVIGLDSSSGSTTVFATLQGGEAFVASHWLTSDVASHSVPSCLLLLLPLALPTAADA